MPPLTEGYGKICCHVVRSSNKPVDLAVWLISKCCQEMLIYHGTSPIS